MYSKLFHGIDIWKNISVYWDMIANSISVHMQAAGRCVFTFLSHDNCELYGLVCEINGNKLTLSFSITHVNSELTCICKCYQVITP